MYLARKLNRCNHITMIKTSFVKIKIKTRVSIASILFCKLHFESRYNLVCHYSNYGALDIASNISLYDVKKFLNSCCQDYHDGFTSLNMTCKFCNNGQKKLYINKKTGSYICDCCNYSGLWTDLKTIFKTSNKKGNQELILPSGNVFVEVNEKWKERFKTSKKISSLSSKERSSVLFNFKIPDVPCHVFDLLDARLDKNSSNVIVPLRNDAQVVGFKEIAIGGAEQCYPASKCQGLIIVNSRKSNKNEAVLVTTLQDLLAVVKAEVSQDVICLPHGHSALPLEILPRLEVYSKLILWFGNTDSCWDSARQFAKKLSEQRCHFVRPTETQPAPYLSLLEGRDIKDILNNATPIWHSSVTTFDKLRQDVLAQLQNVEKARGVKWKRFPSLTNILRGHRRGELTIITGPTGTGKTTFMSEYSLDLASQGVTTLWGSFEIRTERLICTMITQMARMPLATHLDKFNLWADQFERLPLYFLTFHGQQPLKTVMDAVEHAAYVHDVAHVIIDNVQFMLGMTSNEAGSLDRFYRQDAMISAFRNFATSANCHVTLVIHPRKEKDGELLTANSIFGGIKASQEADNILIIQQKTLQSLKLKKFLQIAKNRYCGDLGVVPLEFDKQSLSFAEKKTEQDKTNVADTHLHTLE